ncbi:MAG TPA: MerR family transcriptional regulator [Polyangiaceae bacterium]|nr:MerR family transcriptional regulator [Polyangiaceae bacterium]
MRRIDPLAESEPSSLRSYRIGDVARYVGVSTHALRAWERRYGTVEPHRTPGGSRLYDAAQIDRLKTLKDLTNYGHSIGEVARLSLEELKRLLAATLELSEGR